ncbi:hypothetical protein M2139_000400 [Enterococcus sp. PF1-24]|uniref:glucosyltransferase domain-containing protein n=1 Tax=unclassified Enterococcus TaxID=2608891 RepID=UPI002475FDBC|nr:MULTISPECIES: glucosyltransferase domain-containing protein [unclassified Enterococcus]MDH6363425.1 hypothetical protein [Enterococcus sp. PFB1-1]MDH6400519.1 hypothetical protein [Enterococcus sp. PF1-24]
MTFKREWQEIKNFVTKNKFLIGYTYLLIVLCYGAKLIFYNFSVDTEEFIMLSPVNQFVQWAQMGRYGLYYFKKIFTGYHINPYLINFGTYFMLGLMTNYLCFIFYRIYQKKKGLLIIPSLFVTSAILLEQYNFILQSFEVVTANFLVVISVFMVHLFTHYKKSYFLLFSVILGIIGFSVYPSNYILFILLTIAILIAKINQSENKLSWQQLAAKITPFLLTFLITYLGNQLAYNATMKALDVKKINYIGASIPWGNTSVGKIFGRIGKTLTTIYSGNQSIFFSYAVPIAILLGVAAVFLSKNNRGSLAFLYVSLFLAMNLEFFLLGSIGPIRALAPFFPLGVAFIYYFAYRNFSNKYLRMSLALAICLITFNQGKITANFAIQEHQIYKAQQDFTKDLLSAIHDEGVDDLYYYKLAVYGNKNFAKTTGDVLGHSFYDWDTNSAVQSSYRISNFFEMMDNPQQRIPFKDYLSVFAQLEEMPIFPAEGSVKVQDDIILIKLSEKPK